MSATNYKAWEKWADAYDSDGENTSWHLLRHQRSEEYLKNIDFTQVTAECGKPMTQEEFDRYRASRPANETVLVQPTKPA